MARRPSGKSIESRLTAVERGIRSLHATDTAIIKEMRDGFAQMESLFAHMENRFDQIYNHVDKIVGPDPGAMIRNSLG